jgi:hypothetical protein
VAEPISGKSKWPIPDLIGPLIKELAAAHLHLKESESVFVGGEVIFC